MTAWGWGWGKEPCAVLLFLMLLSRAAIKLSTAGREVFRDKSIHCPGWETAGRGREPWGAGKTQNPPELPSQYGRMGGEGVGKEEVRETHTHGGGESREGGGLRAVNLL